MNGFAEPNRLGRHQPFIDSSMHRTGLVQVRGRDLRGDVVPARARHHVRVTVVIVAIVATIATIAISATAAFVYARPGCADLHAYARRQHCTTTSALSFLTFPVQSPSKS